MIELISNDLDFTFPEVHQDAQLRITFQRTLRLPDDGHTYPLPPGLGSFPLRHVDDFAATVPREMDHTRRYNVPDVPIRGALDQLQLRVP